MGVLNRRELDEAVAGGEVPLEPAAFRLWWQARLRSLPTLDLRLPLSEDSEGEGWFDRLELWGQSPVRLRAETGGTELQIRVPLNHFFAWIALSRAGTPSMLLDRLPWLLQAALPPPPAAPRWMAAPRIPPGRALATGFGAQLSVLALLGGGVEINLDTGWLAPDPSGARLAWCEGLDRVITSLDPLQMDRRSWDDLRADGVPDLRLPRRWFRLGLQLVPTPAALGLAVVPAPGRVLAETRLDTVLRAWSKEEAHVERFGWPVYGDAERGLLDAVSGEVIAAPGSIYLTG